MLDTEPRYIKKVVINTKKGGKFELSPDALSWLKSKAPSVDPIRWETVDSYRTHPLLIECVLALGSKASTKNSNISCIDIKKGIRYLIQRDNGAESVLFPNELVWYRMWAW